MKRFIIGRCSLALASVLVLVLAAPATAGNARGKKKDEGVFDPAPVHRYSLEIPEEGLAVLREDRKEENRRTYVKATFGCSCIVGQCSAGRARGSGRQSRSYGIE